LVNWPKLRAQGHLRRGGGSLERPKQDRKGVIEEVRALATHAILPRTPDPRNDNASTN